MRFLKSVKKPKRLLLKNERNTKKPKRQKPKDKAKKLVQHKTAYSHEERHNSRRKKKRKLKYRGAISSTPEQSENERVYTFSLSPKDSTIDEDCFTISTVSTVSTSSASSREVESESQSLLVCNDRMEGTNLHQMRRRPSSESILSNPSLLDDSASSDRSIINQVDLRDDETEELITHCGNRDVPDSEASKGQTFPPLLPPPRQYVADNHVCGCTNNSLSIDVPHNPLSSDYLENFESRSKLISVRDLRRYASEGSRDYVHVFRQPLMPLDEDISLYDSGNDADDDCSEQSVTRTQNVSRRGSLSSSDDENDLRQRWEFGLAMMAKMGIHAVVVDQSATLNDEDPINTLSPIDCAFDGDHVGEI